MSRTPLPAGDSRPGGETAGDGPADPRVQALNRWLQAIDPTFSPVRPLGSDASFRRYFRSRRGTTWQVIMDAPPEHEDTAPFLQVAEILHGLGLRPPRILAADREQGFLVLEDFGDRTFTRALAAGEPEAPLYRLAAETLQTLQTRWARHRPTPEPPLPVYHTERLLQELRLFIDWYWPEVHGASASAAVRAAFETAWTTTLEVLPTLPKTLVLRDFHVDNLMQLPEPSGLGGCGLLDFQDAVLGSPAYDLVSLLEDARRDVTPALTHEILNDWVQQGPWPAGEFLHHYRVLGVQRTVKIIGIFTRLARRDHKPAYQAHQPRLWRLLASGLEAPELAAVSDWFNAHFDRHGQPCAR